MNIKLKIPTTESDRDDGINDGNIETYKNTPMLSLTKEELQNSTDGALSKEKPVIVEFSVFKISTATLPDIENIKRVFKEDRDYWNLLMKHDRKPVEFCSEALKLLSKDYITILRISDFNTTGLDGVKEKSSPWRNLVKNKGVSDKPSNFGGSFGIGKDAAFACSALRMVFYNTVNRSGEEAFEGVLKIPTYKKDGKNYDSVGFLCKDTADSKTDPLLENISLEPGFTRKECGLDKYIIGFENLNNFKQDIIVSSIENFLWAIYTGKLIIKCQGDTLDNNSLKKYFSKYNDDISPSTKEQYQTILNSDVDYRVSVFEPNDTRILIKLDPDYSRKAGMIRQSGMKVFDKANFSKRIGFSALVIMEGNRINGYFKKLENAEHTNWAFDRAENKQEAQKKQKIILDSIKEHVHDLHKETYDQSIDADGVNEYLPYSFVAGKKKKEQQDQKPNKIRKKKQDEESINQTIQALVNEHGESNAHSESKGNPGHKPEFRFVETDKYKLILSQSRRTCTLKIQPQEDIASGFLSVFIAGETSSTPAKIEKGLINGEETKTSKNKIEFLNLSKGEIYSINFKLKNKGNWALEVALNENQEK